jgi:hypothetical protein
MWGTYVTCGFTEVHYGTRKGFTQMLYYTGTQNFQKVWEPPQNYRHHKSDLKRDPL